MLLWSEFNKRPNLQHFTEEERKRKFLFEEEQMEVSRRAYIQQQHEFMLLFMDGGVSASVVPDTGDYLLTEGGLGLLTENENKIII